MIEDVDEWLRPVDESDPAWFDEMSVAAFDPGASAVLYVALRITAVDPAVKASAAVAVWLDGSVAHVQRATLAEVPPHNWDVMEIGGIGLRMEQARRRWSVHLDDRAARAFLVFDGTGPCEEVESGGYVQAGRLAGDIALAARRTSFDGDARRAHTWGSGSLEPSERVTRLGEVGAPAGASLGAVDFPGAVVEALAGGGALTLRSTRGV